MITVVLLTRDLRVHDQPALNAAARHLVDGDVASNVGNWQSVAGTGVDTQPYRRLSPQRQAECFDPDGAYVRRYVPELAR
jgi:deoxyribodipyrimidine photo-lyase